MPGTRAVKFFPPWEDAHCQTQTSHDTRLVCGSTTCVFILYISDLFRKIQLAFCFSFHFARFQNKKLTYLCGTFLCWEEHSNKYVLISISGKKGVDLNHIWLLCHRSIGTSRGRRETVIQRHREKDKTPRVCLCACVTLVLCYFTTPFLIWSLQRRLCVSVSVRRPLSTGATAMSPLSWTTLFTLLFLW